MIGIVMATVLEASPFIAGLEQVEKKPFRIYRGTNNIVIISGIGKVNAAAASVYLICRYAPDCLYNVGAAGAVDHKYKVGDILHINRIVEYDRPNLADSGFTEVNADIFDGFELAVLATRDRPVISAEDRQQTSEKADLVDMEGAAFLRACKKFSAKSYLFKIVTDTPEHSKDSDIIRNVKKTREKMFNFIQDRVLNKG